MYLDRSQWSKPFDFLLPVSKCRQWGKDQEGARVFLDLDKRSCFRQGWKVLCYAYVLLPRGRDKRGKWSARSFPGPFRRQEFRSLRPSLGWPSISVPRSGRASWLLQRWAEAPLAGWAFLRTHVLLCSNRSAWPPLRPLLPVLSQEMLIGNWY